MDEVIHMDDWKIGPWWNMKGYYNVEEIKVMMRRYAEEVLGTIWEQVRHNIEEGAWYDVYNGYELIQQRIANEVII